MKLLIKPHLKLKSLCVEHGISQKELSVLLDIGKTTLNLKLNGKRDFTQIEIQMIINLFCLSYREIFPEYFFGNKIHATKHYESA